MCSSDLDGDGAFEDVSFASGLAQPSLPFVGFGAIFLDFDHDADLDLFVANGHVYPQIDSSGTNSTYAEHDHLYRNVGDGRFELVLPGAGSPFGRRVSRGASAADFATLAMLNISKALVTGTMGPPGRPSLASQRRSNSLHPPQAGTMPTAVSTRPV